MQRLILLAIASVMSLGFLAACGGGEPVEEPETTEEVTPEEGEMEEMEEGEMEEMEEGEMEEEDAEGEAE